MTPRTITFCVAGDPRPLARHRSRVAGAGGRAWVQTYEPASNRDARAYVRHAANEAMRKAGINELLIGPLELTVTFWTLQPTGKRVKDASRVRPDLLLQRLYPCARPDTDNLVKLVLDALNRVIWRDDAQVCAIRADKRYTTTAPRTEVQVREMTAAESRVEEACEDRNMNLNPAERLRRDAQEWQEWLDASASGHMLLWNARCDVSPNYVPAHMATAILDMVQDLKGSR